MSIILLLNSCSTSELTVNKRRYNKGFYVDFKNKNIEKLAQNVEINSKIETQTLKTEIEKPNSNLSSSILDEPEIIVKNNEKVKTNSDDNKTEKINKISLKKKFPNSKLTKETEINPDEKSVQTYSLISLILSALGVLLMIESIIIPALFFFGMLFATLAIIPAIIALRKYKKLGEFTKWKWMANVGLVTGIVGIVTLIIFIGLMIILIAALGNL